MTLRQRLRPAALLAFGLLALFAAAIIPAAHALAGVPAPAVATSTDPPRFDWPLPGRPTVAQPFVAPASPYGPGHRGVDLAAAPGTPVYAAGSGVVVFAGQLAGRGVVSIDHGLLRTTYEPVTATVTGGEQVRAGQRIGTLDPGHEGCLPGCLHWGVRRGTAPPEYLNPLALLTGYTLRLKPWPD
ncbi:MAG: peptidoglycan DD-metalloendopeptidase family protein [Actinophytocola sp.]|nr:peptidoglycan DD-metalloendopeptidase family protein [Actinophytocola sp.]